MATDFKLPDPGEGIHEAEIVAVKVSADERVEESQVLLEVETDKAVVEVPAPFTGTVTEVLVEVGDRVEVGEAVLRYEEDDEDTDTDVESSGKDGDDEADEDEAAPDEDRDEGKKDRGKGRKTSKSEKEREREERKKESKEEREREDEKKREKEEREKEEREKEERKKEKSGGEEREEGKRADRAGDRPVPAAPATRRLARELDVDLRDVEPSGPEGRVLPEDVRAAAGREEDQAGEPEEAAAKRREAERPEAEEPDGEPGEEETPVTEEEEPSEEEHADREAPEPAPEPGEGEAERWGPVRREPLRSVRRTTAERLSRSWSRVPHVTHFDRADITELEGFREEHAASMEDTGDDLTLTVFVLKAAVAALKEFPRFNAHFDDDAQEVVIFERHNIGLAVDTDRGLLVPVVQDVESKSLAELATETASLQARTRDGKLERDEMRGGSFTLTNPGPIGGTGFTPIINPPQVAILGTARASWEAIVVEGEEGREIVPRKLLPLCLAFDHRVNDGADAARFVSRLVEILESPDELVRHL